MHDRVQNPPPRPLLLWDGECCFCGRCKRWLQRKTGNAIAYQPYREALSAYPELSETKLERAVHLVEPDGAISHSADAVYRVLSHAPGWQWLLRLYRRSRLFAALSEWGYRRVANNRRFISWLTRSRCA